MMAEPADQKTNEGKLETNGNEGKSFETFDEYLNTLEEPIKNLYNSHVSGLKNALDMEKDSRRKLSEQLKSFKDQAEKGSELEGKLTETVKLLDEAERRSAENLRRANFAEQAVKSEIGCTNIKAAYAIAVSENLFADDNNPNWKSIKAVAPELFRTSVQTNAGANKKPITNDINQAIRRAAGLGD